MKEYFTRYSLSITFLFIFLICWGLEYITMSNGLFPNRFWHNNFFFFKLFALLFLGFVIMATILISKGNPQAKESHRRTHEKLDKIIEYLEIDKQNYVRHK